MVCRRAALRRTTTTFFENLVHPDDRARFMELVDCGLKTGQPTTGEWRVIGLTEAFIGSLDVGRFSWMSLESLSE